MLLKALRFEILLQRRTLRFRFGAALCLAIPIFAPFAIFWLLQPHVSHHLGTGTYFSVVFESLRFPTLALAMVVAGNRADLSGARQMWSVLCSSGISNIGYFAYRGVAQAMIVAVLTLIPVATVFGVLAMASLPVHDIWLPIGNWLTLVLPVAVLGVFLWSSLVLITGTELGSLMILIFGNNIAGYLIEKTIQPLIGTKLIIHMDWLGFQNFRNFVYRLAWRLQNQPNPNAYRGYLASDGPFPVEQATEAWFSSAAIYLGLCALIVPLAGFFLRRTRKNLAPLVVADTHPLRNFIKYVHRFRGRYSPDGALRWEPFAALLGLVGLLAAAVFIHHRSVWFSAQAAERYRAETQVENLPPTPPAAGFLHWKITGQVSTGGVRAESVGIFRNGHESPLERISFSLNPFLKLEVEAPGKRVEIERRWDRVLLEVLPAVAPEEELAMTFRVEGRPRNLKFDLNGWWRQDSFATRYEAMLADAGPSQGNDLSQSQTIPSISAGRLELDAQDLLPVLRYGSWQLTAKPVLEGERGYEVPGPESFPLSDIEVDLQVPEGWVIGDSCGRINDPKGKLMSSCRESLARYRLAGGYRTLVQADDRIVIAAIPGHEQIMDLHSESINAVIDLSGEAWPGVEPIERLVVLERPAEFFPFNPNGDMWRRGRQFSISGRLLEIPESVIVANEPLPPEQIVGSVMARDLLRRRNLDPTQSWVFERMFGALMARRMGLEGSRAGAAISGKGFEERAAKMPVLDLEFYTRYVFEVKVPALLAYLQSLVGAENLYAGLEEFLSSDSEEPGTVAQLIESLERRSGKSLQRFYEDFFVGESLPKLKLKDVQARKDSDGWRVTGLFVNTGTGEVTCPVVVKSERQQRRLELTVEDHQEVPFEVRLDLPPHTVQLDPEDTCFRWVTLGRMRVERVSLLVKEQ